MITQVKAEVTTETLRKGKPQKLSTIIADCTVKVPKAKEVGPLTKRLTGKCFWKPPAPITRVIKSNSGSTVIACCVTGAH